MLARGRLQILQSEGNATEKTLRTTVNHGATRKEHCSARPASRDRCRSRVARLLKTTLQSMVPARDTLVRRPSEGTEAFSISDLPRMVQCRLRFPVAIHRVFMGRRSQQLSLVPVTASRGQKLELPRLLCVLCVLGGEIPRHYRIDCCSQPMHLYSPPPAC